MKHCLSCNQDGHTYQDCPNLPFSGLFSIAIGFESILGPSFKEMQERILTHSSQIPEEPK